MSPQKNPVNAMLKKIRGLRGKARPAEMLINIRDFENLLQEFPANTTFGPVTIQYDRGCLRIKRVRA